MKAVLHKLRVIRARRSSASPLQFNRYENRSKKSLVTVAKSKAECTQNIQSRDEKKMNRHKNKKISFQQLIVLQQRNRFLVSIECVDLLNDGIWRYSTNTEK